VGCLYREYNVILPLVAGGWYGRADPDRLRGASRGVSRYGTSAPRHGSRFL
jgi:hypothetical protein